MCASADWLADGAQAAARPLGAVEVDEQSRVMDDVVAQELTRLLPELFDSAMPVHHPDHGIDGWRKTEEPLRCQFLQNVPRLSAILVAVDFGVAA